MQSPSIEITVNGERKAIPAGQSVLGLLDSLAIASERVAVELNKAIVRKRDWRQVTVPAGSQIEIVEFVGGG